MQRHSLSRADIKKLFGVELITPKGPQARRLTKAELEATFNVRPEPKLSRKQKDKAKAADEMFGDMYRIYGMSSLTIFRAAAVEIHARILHHMSECPEFVLEYMKTKLNRSVVEALHQSQAKKLRATIEKAETSLRKLV